MPMRRLVVLAALSFALSLLGCSTSPTPVPSGSTTASEGSTQAASAQPESSDLATAFGGEYKSPELASYVTEVGKRVAAKSEHPDLPYTFTVLDTPIVNAFAGSNGDIYVTRGLLALANNEAQLAAVLGHEIGHAIAASQARVSSAQAPPQPSPDVRAEDEVPALRDMQLPAIKYLVPFSSDIEEQASRFAARSVQKAGYDPHAMARLLASMREYEALDAKTSGRKPESLSRWNYLSTHTNAIDLYNRALAGISTNARLESPGDQYLAHIEGVLFGEPPGLGTVNGSVYKEPESGVGLVAWRGFEWFVTPERAYALGPKDSVMVFDGAPDLPAGSLKDYIANEWAKGLVLRNLHAGHLRRMDAAIALAPISTPLGAANLRLFVVRGDDKHLYRLRGEFPTAAAVLGEYAFLKTLSSIRMLPQENAGSRKERRIKLVTVRPGEKIETLSGNSSLPDPNADYFRVFNGLGPKDAPQPGAAVKIVQ